VTAEEQYQRRLWVDSSLSRRQGRIERFSATTYLSPVPPEPFIALRNALVERLPMFRPYGGIYDDAVPHLTVAHGDATAARSAAVQLNSGFARCHRF
jgi:2'-5' RNA ligase superfamily